jgi:hypothetical protein
LVIGGDGTVYVVGKNNPQGTPGTSNDYTPLTSSDGGRPGRDLGGSTVPHWTPPLSPELTPGQLIEYNNQLYIVQNPNPQGTPGSSPDFQQMGSGGTPGQIGRAHV